MPKNRSTSQARLMIARLHLEQRTVDDLVQLARDIGINASTRWRKETIIDHLIERRR